MSSYKRKGSMSFMKRIKLLSDNGQCKGDEDHNDKDEVLDEVLESSKLHHVEEKSLSHRRIACTTMRQ